MERFHSSIVAFASGLRTSASKTVGNSPRKSLEANSLQFNKRGATRTLCTPATSDKEMKRIGPATPLYSLIPMPIETEIKFRVADLAGLAQRLNAGGFQLQTPRSFENNVLYDSPDRQLRARTEILRIRSYAGRWTLTHKRLPTNGPSEDRHKHRIETETEICDGEALAEVFHSLGLVVAFRYEKWRTEWRDGESHCVIDETPIGDYAELEGSPEWIDRTAGRLEVTHAEYLTSSYGRLFDLWRERHHSNAEVLTFAAVAHADSHG
jgi:adenylate cyclase class 2